MFPRGSADLLRTIIGDAAPAASTIQTLVVNVHAITIHNHVEPSPHPAPDKPILRAD